MIAINETAKTKIREIYAQNPGQYFRIVVDGDGCAGPYFGLSLDQAGPGENPVMVEGIGFLISDAAQRYSEVTTINIFVNPVWQEPPSGAS